MLATLHVCGTFILDLFKSRSRLHAENLFLRHQLNIALRKASPRLRLHSADPRNELCGKLGDDGVR
jgi:hypothetical protein